MDKVSSFSKDAKINSLEELVVKIGFDPAKARAVEELLKKKNANIDALRKKLKMPATEDPFEKYIE